MQLEAAASPNTVHLRVASRRSPDGRLGSLTCQKSGMGTTGTSGMSKASSGSLALACFPWLSGWISGPEVRS
jgi:hypothetical protein